MKYFCQLLSRKDENKETEAGNGPFKKTGRVGMKQANYSLNRLKKLGHVKMQQMCCSHLKLQHLQNFSSATKEKMENGVKTDSNLNFSPKFEGRDLFFKVDKKLINFLSPRSPGCGGRGNAGLCQVINLLI